MSRPRLLVLDIDGTLVGRDNTAPTPRVRAALEAARRAGTRIALCTGRPMTSLIKIAEPLDLAGPHVAFDGALVSAHGLPPVYRVPLPDDAAARLVAAAREVRVCVELYRVEAHYVETLWPEALAHAELIRVDPVLRPLDDLIAESAPGEIIKGQLIGEGEDGRARIRRVEALGLPLRFGWATPPPGHRALDYVNVTHPEVNKGVALEALAAALDVPMAETMAVGDGPNDAPLLRLAGLAVAMGNSTPDLKEIAHVVAPHVDDDGLAVVIERYVLGR